MGSIEPMRRMWLSIAWTIACIMSGLTATSYGQHLGCDSVQGACPSCCQQRQRVGVCIPSLQFLVVDRLSAAGDRFQNTVHRGSTCNHACGLPSTAVSRRHASCGVEHCPVPEPPSQPVAGRITDSEDAHGDLEQKRVDANGITDGGLNDQPSSTALVPVPPSVPINAPLSKPEFAPPKLMPTPVSEPLSVDSYPAPSEITPSASIPERSEVPRPMDEPKPTDTPEVSEGLSEVDSIPGFGPLPSEGKPLPPPPSDPLPDILVDPFIDDVGQSRSQSGVALAGGTVRAPNNALRGSEPKRLKKSERKITSSDPEAPKPTRIIIKRSIERKISQ